MATLKILQIVGYKNSGKTTLIKSWIEQCLQEGEEVAVIKHHGHSNGLAMPASHSDSMIFYEAGAKSTIVSDHATIQFHQRSGEWSLKQSIALAQVSEPSIIFIEGFKRENFPKVVLVKNETEWQSLKKLSNIVLVLSHDSLTISDYPSIPLQEKIEWSNWLKHWIRG